MQNPDLQTWLLASDGISTRLRSMRGDRSSKEFAEAAGMRPSKLSKLELAQQTPTREDIAAIVAASGAGSPLADELTARLAEVPAVIAQAAHRNRFGQVANQRRLNRLLEGAGTVRMFDTTYFPRVLQNLDYAVAALAGLARLHGTADDSARAAETLVSSGDILGQGTSEFLVAIAEPVLRWRTVPAPVMRAQLLRLLHLPSAANIQLRVLPLGAALEVFPSVSFALLDDTSGFSDTIEGARALEGDRLRGHQELMDAVWTSSVDGDAAATLVQSAIDAVS